MIKLYASDLDGTLFNESHRMDDFVKDTIRMVKESGATFSIATGRDLHACRCTDMDLETLDGYAIANNGALIMTMQRDVIYKNPLSKEVVQHLFSAFPKARFECVTLDKTYVRYDEDMWYERFLNAPFNKGKTKEDVQEFIKDIVFGCSDEEILKQEILKVNLFFRENEDRESYDQYVKENRDCITNGSSMEHILELTGYNVTKASAISKLAQILQVKEEEVAVFGDGGNDVDMLKRFTNSYAPKEAMEEAKQAASFHLGSYKDHAVCKQIRKMIKG